MSSFAFFLLCVQACLIQNVYSQCLGAGLGLGYAPGLATELAYGPGLGLGYGLAGPGALGNLGCNPGPAYGGTGIGDVAVAGELGVAGSTLVAGQVPILGAVRFGGEVPAGGCVSITGSCSGNCGCGCNGGYLY
ncbi:unnamed protein product [Parnassius mnemosyne]|uniref:Chorion class A protein Ld2/Ld41 n=1 Tax=Parnassius mnemosyne TaxID=213953 RepID=A0AAV1LE80_9NEOP